MRFSFSLFFCCCLQVAYSQSKQLCITIDDLPSVTYELNSTELDNEITACLTRNFIKYKIPAIGYVCEGKLYLHNELDPSKVAVLEKWLEAGCDLGNHTYSHFDYNKVPDSVFFEDVIAGQKITKALLEKNDQQLRFFRHPYLHTGADSVAALKLHQFLKSHNYKEAPVTIDNDDYFFAKVYHEAYVKRKTALMAEIGKDYVNYMEEKLHYFEQKSIAVFGKEIPQALLIHASLLNAHYIDELAEMFIKNGYTFISQKEILKTPEYQSPINVYSQKGLSWIFRWGLSKGIDPTLMDNDIEIPPRIVKLAK